MPYVQLGNWFFSVAMKIFDFERSEFAAAHIALTPKYERGLSECDFEPHPLSLGLNGNPAELAG